MNELRIFGQALDHLWRYLILEYGLGMVTAIISDSIVTSLFVASLAIALTIAVHWGVIVFFTLYTIIRVINTVANAIGASGRLLAQTFAQRSNMTQ